MTLVICKQCAAILNSKHRHHFVMCGCPNETFVDGGNECFRRGGKDMSKVLTCLTGAEARRLSQGLKEIIAKKQKT
jgi:hypothetical protein